MHQTYHFIILIAGSVGSADDSSAGQTEVYNSAEDSPNRSPPATAPKPKPKPSVPTPPDSAGMALNLVELFLRIVLRFNLI